MSRVNFYESSCLFMHSFIHGGEGSEDFYWFYVFWTHPRKTTKALALVHARTVAPKYLSWSWRQLACDINSNKHVLNLSSKLIQRIIWKCWSSGWPSSDPWIPDITIRVRFSGLRPAISLSFPESPRTYPELCVLRVVDPRLTYGPALLMNEFAKGQLPRV